MEKSECIWFYRSSDEYGFMSNFYRKSPFTVGVFKWKTSEHYYQAHKAVEHDDFMRIYKAETPGEAAEIGRSIKCREDWQDVKYDFMMEAIRHKFAQNPKYMVRLLETGDKPIVEWTEGTVLADSEWGNAKDKDGNPGKNLLGKALMQLREELKQDKLEATELDI
jgi:ribA/ribD-fused uncharacterized protein